MLHSGHVAFFESAATYGDLYVGIGSDKTVMELKNRAPINQESERLYMVKSIRWVKDAWINSGVGVLDFEPELTRLIPDYFIVNTDGASDAKKQLCEKLGIRYIVMDRVPSDGLPARSTTAYRRMMNKN